MKLLTKKDTNKLRKILKKLESSSKVCSSWQNLQKTESEFKILPPRTKITCLNYSWIMKRLYWRSMKFFSQKEPVPIKAQASHLRWFMKMEMEFMGIVQSELWAEDMAWAQSGAIKASEAPREWRIKTPICLTQLDQNTQNIAKEAFPQLITLTNLSNSISQTSCKEERLIRFQPVIQRLILEQMWA